MRAIWLSSLQGAVVIVIAFQRSGDSPLLSLCVSVMSFVFRLVDSSFIVPRRGKRVNAQSFNLTFRYFLRSRLSYVQKSCNDFEIGASFQFLQSKMSKHTFFQQDWLLEPCFKDWVQQVPRNAKVVMCNVYNKTIELSNMGRRALTSHMKGTKHQKKMRAKHGSTSFFGKKDGEAESKVVVVSCSNIADATGTVSCSDATGTVSCVDTPGAVLPNNSSVRKNMKSYLIKDSVTKTEILWTI